VNCDVIGFVALDEILRLFFGSVVGVAFEFHFGNDFLHDGAANSTCFRVPLDVIATLERLGHHSVATEPRGSIPPSNGSAHYSITALWPAAQHNILVTFVIMKNGDYERTHHCWRPRRGLRTICIQSYQSV